MKTGIRFWQICRWAPPLYALLSVCLPVCLPVRLSVRPKINSQDRILYQFFIVSKAFSIETWRKIFPGPIFYLLNCNPTRNKLLLQTRKWTIKLIRVNIIKFSKQYLHIFIYHLLFRGKSSQRILRENNYLLEKTKYL